MVSAVVEVVRQCAYGIKTMDFQNMQNLNCSPCGETFEKLSFTSLEIDALNCLEETIKSHEMNSDDGDQFPADDLEPKAESISEQNSMFNNLSQPCANSTRACASRKLNAGYIIFDGSEIKYISTGKTETTTISKPSEELRNDCSFRSRTSDHSTHIFELASHLNLSSDDLIRDSFKDTISRLSLTPYKRLPTYVHFSTIEKFYLLAIGAVPSLLLNTFYISVAFFRPFLGKQVLSEIGKLPFCIISSRWYFYCWFLPCSVRIIVLNLIQLRALGRLKQTPRKYCFGTFFSLDHHADSFVSFSQRKS